MASFADLVDDMDATLMESLNDGTGEYHDAGGRCVARNLKLMVDHNLQRIGPDGAVFRTDATGITFLRSELKSTTRGGVFRFNCKRYVVEEEIEDDGQWVVAACMEAP